MGALNVFHMDGTGGINHKILPLEWVYFVSGWDYIKIGATREKNPFTRIVSLSSSSPRELDVIAFLCTTPWDAFDIESQMHRRFSENRIKGEWFDMGKKRILSHLERYYDRCPWLERRINNTNRHRLTRHEP